MSTNNNRITTYYIYKITFNSDGRTYIGQRRCPSNKTPETDYYMGSGVHLKRAQKKYGLDKFSKEILAICYNQNILDILEIQYIALYKEIGKAEFNFASGGNVVDYWNYYTESQKLETRRKIREARARQAPMSEESKQKYKKSIQVYWSSPEGIKQKQINSENHKGLHTTKEKHWYNNGIKNIQCFECPDGFVPGRLGNFTQSEEVKQRKREIERNFTPEQREERSRKISAAHKGIAFTEERKRHISEAKKGKPGRKQTDNIRNKIAENMKGKKRFTNGIIEVRAYECPEGFVHGTLKNYSK